MEYGPNERIAQVPGDGHTLEKGGLDGTPSYQNGRTILPVYGVRIVMQGCIIVWMFTTGFDNTVAARATELMSPDKNERCHVQKYRLTRL